MEDAAAVNISLAAGEELRTTKLVHVTVTFGDPSSRSGVQYQAGCYVLPGLSHDLVLGMDFLAHCNPEIDFAGGVMTFASGLRVVSVESTNVVLSSVQQLHKLVR